MRLPTMLHRVSGLPGIRARLGIGLAVVALGAGAAGAAGAATGAQPKLKAPNLAGLRAAAPAGLLSGPDVSSNNHLSKNAIKWGQVLGGGRAFTIVKATGEHGYTNPWFKRDWVGAGQAGLIRAAYHFAQPSRASGDAVVQAQKFVKVVSSAGGLNSAGTLPLVLDLEQSDGLRPAALQAWTRSFLTTVEKLTHRPPMIYTYKDFWRHQMGNAKTFTHYPLWIASYTGGPPNPLPGGWKTWTLWQYTANGRLPGVRGPVDLSVFCCSAQALTTLADGRPNPVLTRWIASGGLAGPLGAPLGPLRVIPSASAALAPAGLIPPAPVTASASASASPTATPSPAGSAAAPTPTATGTTAGATPTPTPSVSSPPFVGGFAEDFTGGSVYAGPGGTFVVKGGAEARYVSLGGPAGTLGWPTADTSSADPGGGFAARGLSAPVVSTFTGGTLVAPGGLAGSLSTAAPFEIAAGPTLDRWNSDGGILGPLSIPTADTAAVTGGLETVFAGGVITSSATRGTHELSGGILATWLGLGGADSSYGLPSSDVYATATGFRADFGSRSITSS